MDYLKERHKTEIQMDREGSQKRQAQAEIPITIDMKGNSLAAAFEAMEDKFPSLKFVVATMAFW